MSVVSWESVVKWARVREYGEVRKMEEKVIEYSVLEGDIEENVGVKDEARMRMSKRGERMIGS